MTAAFKKFDVDDCGTLDYKEFSSLIKKANIGLSDTQLYELMCYIDEDDNAVVDLKEFVNSFDMVSGCHIIVVTLRLASQPAPLVSTISSFSTNAKALFSGFYEIVTSAQ